MARVTVEDCILNVPNRFDLVVMAAQRAKQIASGNPLTIDRDNDKDAVVSLREIADKTVSLDGLEAEVVTSFCKRHAHEAIDVEVEKDAVQGPDEISDAFEDARQHIAVGDKTQGGLSFSEENIEVED